MGAKSLWMWKIGDAVKAFKKISAQNKVIFKLEAELSKLRNSFESLKDNHAS